jgi:hypothetical protein
VNSTAEGKSRLSGLRGADLTRAFGARGRSRFNRGLWRKVKCLHREEFVVVGWTDPEGSRLWLGALLLAYYDPAHGLLAD